MPNENESVVKEQIARSLRARETEELLQIWKENDRSQWTDLAIGVAGEILQERLGEVPAQDTPAQQVVTAVVTPRKPFHKSFLYGWLLVNLIGWIGVVLYVALFKNREILEQLANTTDVRYIPDSVIVILGMIGLPLGVCLGILQSFQAGGWKIPMIPWILVTAIGWWIPAIGLSQLRWSIIRSENLYFYYDYRWIIYPAVLLFIGAFVGTLQALVMREKMPRPGLWALANALGVLALGLAVYALLGLSIGILSGPIVLLVNPQMRSGLAAMPLSTLLLLIGAVTPVLAALLTGLPTGIVFDKFGSSN
jgi:hypothetical protein